MEITDIKKHLSIETVLSLYQLSPDKHQKICCPFHEEKTPSCTIYPKTNTFHCFGCGVSGDAIEFIQLKENITKHEAILKAQALIGVPPILTPESKPQKPLPPQDSNEPKELPRLAVMSKIAQETKASFKRTEIAQNYIHSRNLDPTKLEIGYIGKELGKGWNKLLCESGLNIGILRPTMNNGTAPKFTSCVVFFTRNDKGQVTDLYARSILTPSESSSGKHFYLNGTHEGIYPAYPKPDIRKLILTECIIDCATLQQQESITSQYGLIALYGVNGFTKEMEEAVKGLQQLQEIILFFDGDKAGQEAVASIAKKLKQLKPIFTISYVETPEGEDINSLSMGHKAEVFSYLLSTRKPFLFLTEPRDVYQIKGVAERGEPCSDTTSLEEENPPLSEYSLNTDNPEKLRYQTSALRFTIWGGVETENLHRLKVNLLVEHTSDNQTYYQDDVNLYSHLQLQRFIKGVAEELEISSGEVKASIRELSSLLTTYRLQVSEQQRKALLPKHYQMSREEAFQAYAFLKGKDLVQRTMGMIEKSGLVGEQKNALLLFFLYISRLMDEPLHAIIFGKSGSGKTYLQTRVSECLPEESLRTITSLTENTLYYSSKDFWKHKVLLIEDLEGVYNAFLPLREFMSKQSISKLTTDKDAKGNNVQKLLTVEGPICVSGATTQESIYEDNANRSFLLIIDESHDHLNEVMHYQRRMQAGLVDEKAQAQAKGVLKNAQRLLKTIRVINPYATRLEIPQCVFKKLRTNVHYLKLIEIITLYHQYQRAVKTGADGTQYLSTTLEDIRWANYLVKDTLLRKSDELSGELRQFFESLKSHIAGNKVPSFYSKDIRETFRMNPMRVNRYLRELESRGYIAKNGGNRKNGFEYEVLFWDEYEKLKTGVDILDEIWEKLSGASSPLEGEKGSVTEV